jgi:hypothetical protein
MNNPAVAQLIQGQDIENCLEYLSDFYEKEPKDVEMPTKM